MAAGKAAAKAVVLLMYRRQKHRGHAVRAKGANAELAPSAGPGNWTPPAGRNDAGGLVGSVAVGPLPSAPRGCETAACIEPSGLRDSDSVQT